MKKKYIPFLCLLTVGIMDFLLITAEPILSFFTWHLTENYMIIPVLLFFGYALGRDLPKSMNRRMVLAGLMICWFLVVQIHRKLTGMGRHAMGTVFLAYLLAFPFAGVTKDIKGAGIKLVGRLFVTASVILAVYEVILLLNVVPAAWQEFLFWDGARANILRHANLTAEYFLLGIGLSMCLFFQSEKKAEKVLLLLLIPVQFVAASLTHCRTALLLISAFLGGTLFLVIWKKGIKQFIVGLMATLVVLVGTYWLSEQIFQKHNDLLIARITMQAEKEKEANTQEREQTADTQEREQTADTQEREQTADTQEREQAADTQETEQASDAQEAEQVADVQETETWKEETEANKQEAGLEYTVENGEISLVTHSPQNTLAKDFLSLNGRTTIWKSAFRAVRDDPSVALWGTEYADLLVSAYNPFPVGHCHNAWVETLMRLGVPGFLMSLVFTLLALRSGILAIFNHRYETWKKVTAILMLCILISGMVEPYLFITIATFHVAELVFFLCLGYLLLWSDSAHQPE